MSTSLPTSGDFCNEPENCGVEFDPSSAVRDPADDLYLAELLGECEEEDEECIARFLEQRKKASGAFSANGLKVGVDEVGSNLSRVSKTPTPIQSVPPTAELYFKDLPNEYFRKKFEPDYPADLQMKQVCTAKPIRRRTLGLTRTQPRAAFIPSRTKTDYRQEEKDNKVASSASKTGKKSAALSTGGTSLQPEALIKGFPMDEPSPLEQNRLPPPVESSSDEVIVDWLEDHNVQMMFEYFLGLCVIHQPENPWTFISALCSKMIEARTDLTAFDMVPRVLTPEHSEAIFRIYDRIENGFLTVPQYKSAMDAMGLNSFSTNPKGWEENAISKDTFVKEATEAIDDLLRTFMVFEQGSEEEEESPSNDDFRKRPSEKSESEKVRRSTSRSYSGSRSSYSRSGSGSAENSPEETANENEEEDDEEEDEEEEEENGLEEVEYYEDEEEYEGPEENEVYENEHE